MVGFHILMMIPNEYHEPLILISIQLIENSNAGIRIPLRLDTVAVAELRPSCSPQVRYVPLMSPSLSCVCISLISVLF